MNQRKSYSADEINKITESVSVLDYFQYLEKQGKVQFDRKSGHDYYFRTDEHKFSVNENGYYDFKTLENKLKEKGININDFQMRKEQTNMKIAEISDKIENELPLLREKMINQYRAEKKEKLKNYNPIDFVKEREEENREFFKLRPKEEKVAEKEEIMQEPTKSRMRR